jgi:integrase
VRDILTHPLAPAQTRLINYEEDGFMGGTIRCARRTCGRVMTGRVCGCGSSTCYVVIYHRGKDWRYRRDKQGDVLTWGKAIKLLNSIREQIDSRTFDPEARLDSRVNERRFEAKWDAFVDEKDERVAGGELSPSYVRVLKSYRRSYFGDLDGYDVRDITLEHLAKVKRSMKGRKIKTKQNVMAALSSFFSWCKNEDGSLPTVPRFPTIEGDDATPRVAIDRSSQEAALVRIPEGLRDPFAFAMETGLRPGEVCALKVKDIQGDNALICRTYSDYTIRETTKQKRKQYIPLSDAALAIVHRNSLGKHPDTFVFINPRSGDGYRPKTLGDIWNKYAGIDVTLYEATRHSFCTQLVEDGVQLSIIRDLARHSDIRTTQKYVHPTGGSARQAVNHRGQGTVHNLESERKAKGKIGGKT